ncbi:MAG: DUF742 domain-containing protein [Stackebrandtia sp.]
MIRSYTATGGTVHRARRRLDRFTLLAADVDMPLQGLAPEPYRVVTLCAPGQLSIAEVGHYLALPAAVVESLVNQLLDSGHLAAREPLPSAQHDLALLEKVLDALHKL